MYKAKWYHLCPQCHAGTWYEKEISQEEMMSIQNGQIDVEINDNIEHKNNCDFYCRYSVIEKHELINITKGRFIVVKNKDNFYEILDTETGMWEPRWGTGEIRKWKTKFFANLEANNINRKIMKISKGEN